jgi:hypothetical protein
MLYRKKFIALANADFPESEVPTIRFNPFSRLKVLLVCA